MRTAICMLTCFVFASSSSYFGAVEKGERAALWASYHNERFNYCIFYPSRWHHEEPVTRNGIILAPPVPNPYVFEPTITAGAAINQTREGDDQPETLEDIFDSGIRGLQKYDKAEGITVLGKEKLTLDGLDALATTIRYGQDGKEWFDKDVNLIDKRQIVYFAELKCHPNDAAALLPVFDRIVKSLRLHCAKNSHRTVN